MKIPRSFSDSMPIGEDSPLKAHALGDPEARDDAPLDLLAGLPTVFCERISCKIRESLDTCRRCSFAPYVIETSSGQSSRLD
jgi:hypothetical protein